MSSGVRIWDESYTAAADLSTHQHKFVKLTGVGVDVCGAGEMAAGILVNDPTSGRAAAVRHVGIELLVVNGNSVNIAFGDNLESAANGIGVKSTADKKIIGGIALGAATADGVKIPVLVLGPKYSSL